MGLDSYVFRVTKPEGLEDRVYSLDEIKALGLSAYLAKYQDEPIFRELKPYCVKVRIDAPYINLQSIREAYGFGEDADVVAQCSDGTITVSERRPDGSYHRQEISGAEMREKHLVNRVEVHNAFRKERVAYWRKDYEIEDFFMEKHEYGIENTGYYILDLETMSQYRIQNQIAVYKTNKKLVEFNDKLKAAPVEYYGHIHAQGEKLNDGSRPRSCIGMILQDYSKGTGENTIRVMANLSPEFFTYALSRVKIGVEQFEFSEEKIFGEPDAKGLSFVTKVSIKRASVDKDGRPRNYPWCIMVENGRGAKESTQTGGIHMKKGSYVKGNMVFVNINDYDFFCLMVKTCRFIETWELTNGPKQIREARQIMAQEQAAQANS